MADLGLALGDAIPKIINMRSSIADLQDRAKRMRMEEELHLPRKQALEGSVEAQNIANQTNTMALNEAKMNAERRNQPVDLNKLDWTDPFVHITAQVAQRTGRWSDIPTRGQIEDTQKEIITNPQLYVKDFQDQFTAIQTSKEYTALKRESEVTKANIAEQKKIINTSTNIKEIQKAREEIEKINEASSGTKEQLDVIEAKRSKLLKAMSTFDKSIELKQMFEDNKSLLSNLSPQVQQSLQIAVSMGDTGTVGKILEEQSKAKDETVIIDIKGNKIAVSPQTYMAHVDKEAAREQAKIFHDENVAIRKEIADLNINLRTRIPAQKAQEIGEKTQVLDRYAALIDSFKDEYGGKVILGPTGTKIYERLGTNKDRVRFWKNFNELDSLIRHKLFGATLTGYELENWINQTVSENTSPIISKDRMRDRLNWAKNALQRELDSYETAGYGVGNYRGKNIPQKQVSGQEESSGQTSTGNRFIEKEIP